MIKSSFSKNEVYVLFNEENILIFKEIVDKIKNLGGYIDEEIFSYYKAFLESVGHFYLTYEGTWVIDKKVNTTRLNRFRDVDFLKELDKWHEEDVEKASHSIINDYLESLYKKYDILPLVFSLDINSDIEKEPTLTMIKDDTGLDKLILKDAIKLIDEIYEIFYYIIEKNKYSNIVFYSFDDRSTSIVCNKVWLETKI